MLIKALDTMGDQFMYAHTPNVNVRVRRKKRNTPFAYDQLTPHLGIVTFE